MRRFPSTLYIGIGRRRRVKYYRASTIELIKENLTMSQFRVTITNPTQDKPDQFYGPTEERVKSELKKWAEAGHHGKYKIVEVVERVVDEGEC